MSDIKRGDWVKCKSMPDSFFVGHVKRIAKDGSWCDVDWHSHTKRMKTEYLFPVHTINCGDFTVTDCTREAELKETTPQ